MVIDYTHTHTHTHTHNYLKAIQIYSQYQSKETFSLETNLKLILNRNYELLPYYFSLNIVSFYRNVIFFLTYFDNE